QGRNGSGKNSFANSLIISDHPALYFFNATAEPGDNVAALLMKAAENNHADSIEILEKRIDDIMFRGQQPVLIINDAEQVAESDLRDLIKFAQSKKDSNQQTQLKLLLLGDHSLENRLDHNGIVNHNQFYIIELPRLNVSNTRSFLTHRLTQAGFRDASPFSDKDICNIYSMANGNIVATMEYAAESLNNNKSLYADNYSANQKTKKSLIIFGAVLFIAAIIYNSLLTSPDSSTDKDKLKENTKLEIPAYKEQNKEHKAIDQLFTPSTNTMDIKQQDPELKLPVVIPEFSFTPDADMEKDINEKTLIESIQLVEEKPAETPVETEKSVSEKQTISDTVAKKPATQIPQATSGIAAPVQKTDIEKKPDIKAQSTPVVKPQTKPVIKKTDKVTQSFINA
ncbi:MAG: hypothetical protein KAU21_05525, partial [Gammaproteobacteria bacterium]|nr:hypothetical protein [Gammaproteobacteria bacterium]